MRLGVEQGADLVEIDIRRTADGALVVMHDATLNRTTDVGEIFPDRTWWSVGDFTLAELQLLDAGSWFSEEFAGEPIPTLDQILETLRGRAGLLLEVKSPSLYPGIAEDTLDTLQSYPGLSNVAAGGARLVVQSFDHGFMEAFNELAPDVPVGLLGNPPSDEVLVEVSAWADQINPQFRTVDRALVERVHELGMSVSVYTLNQTDDMRAAIELGVDGIITNYPARLEQVLEQRAEGGPRRPGHRAATLVAVNAA